MSTVSLPRHLPLSLFLIRVSVVLMLTPWVADKFINPGHAIAVFEGFYGLGGIAENLVLAIGVAQVALLLCFALGLLRFWSYGLVMLMHAGSTLSSWKQYLAPFDGANLLFFAAWPMLAACIALFMLREHDSLLSVGGRPSVAEHGIR